MGFPKIALLFREIKIGIKMAGSWSLDLNPPLGGLLFVFEGADFGCAFGAIGDSVPKPLLRAPRPKNLANGTL